MNDKKSFSSSELSAFMDNFDLKDGYGNARFNATIQFDIENQETFYIDADVMINRGGYNNYGQLTLLNDLPTNVPVEFSANFQDFKFVYDSGLKISGIHRNTSIGRYSLFVIPKP